VADEDVAYWPHSGLVLAIAGWGGGMSANWTVGHVVRQHTLNQLQFNAGLTTVQVRHDYQAQTKIKIK